MSDTFESNSFIKLGPTPQGQILFFFGMRHSNNPLDKQFSQLQQLWNEFLDTAKDECLMLTEGKVKDVVPDFSESIKQRGEVGAAQWLAKSSKIIVECPEPDDTKQREILCSLFSAHDIVYAFIVQNLSAWFRQTTHRSTFLEAIRRTLIREAKFAAVYGFIPDTFWFSNQHKKLFGDQQLEDHNFLDKITDPRQNDTIVNRIIAERSKIRNDYILERITYAWNLKKNIFIVYGKDHLAVLELSLRTLVK